MVINSTIKNKVKILFYNKYESQPTVSTSGVWSLCSVPVPCLYPVCFLYVSCVCLLSARGVWRVPVVLSGRSGIYTHTDPSQWSNKGQILVSKKKTTVYANNASRTMVYDNFSWADNFAECCIYVNSCYAPSITKVYPRTPIYFTYILTNTSLSLCECVVFSLLVNCFCCSISAYAEFLER